MAVLTLKPEWPGFDREGEHETPFPPLNHDKMPSGVSRLRVAVLNINIPSGMFHEKDSMKGKLEKREN